MGQVELIHQAADLGLHFIALLAVLVEEVARLVVALTVERGQALHDDGDVLRVPILIYTEAQDVDAGDDAVECAGIDEVPHGSLLHAHAQVHVDLLIRHLLELLVFALVLVVLHPSFFLICLGVLGHIRGHTVLVLLTPAGRLTGGYRRPLGFLAFGHSIVVINPHLIGLICICNRGVWNSRRILRHHLAPLRLICVRF